MQKYFWFALCDVFCQLPAAQQPDGAGHPFDHIPLNRLLEEDVQHSQHIVDRLRRPMRETLRLFAADHAIEI